MPWQITHLYQFEVPQCYIVVAPALHCFPKCTAMTVSTYLAGSCKIKAPLWVKYTNIYECLHNIVMKMYNNFQLINIISSFSQMSNFMIWTLDHDCLWVFIGEQRVDLICCMPWLQTTINLLIALCNVHFCIFPLLACSWKKYNTALIVHAHSEIYWPYNTYDI